MTSHRLDLRRIDGQTTAEYLGGLVIVSVIVAAIALTTVGTSIRQHIECTVASIVGRHVLPTCSRGTAQ